jgi:hypothetical protein
LIGLLLMELFLPMKGHIRILIAAIISILGFAADAKNAHGQQVGPEVLDANGNFADRHRQ